MWQPKSAQKTSPAITENRFTFTRLTSTCRLILDGYDFY